MKKKKNYLNFYEKIDREFTYSAGLHSKGYFYRVLENFKKKADNNLKVLEIGAGNGNLQDIFSDYTGIDITKSNRKYFHKPYITIEDGKPYPFRDQTFDLIFTTAVFEHIPLIDFALKEMIRVLKPEGNIIFNPAWQCRPWAAEGYPVRPYSDFNFFGKLYKFSIIFRENLFFRLSYTIPKRFLHLLKYLINKKSYKNRLRYKKINPNYEKFWMSDSDACNSIDPFLAILYFKANRFLIINYKTLMSQFCIRTNEIILKKMSRISNTK